MYLKSPLISSLKNTRENSGRMTKADLIDWVVSQGCETELLPEYKAKVIFIVNPKSGTRSYINLPIDKKPLKAFTVCKTCSDLRIPIPTFAAYMKPLHDIIDKDNNEDNNSE